MTSEDALQVTCIAKDLAVHDTCAMHDTCVMHDTCAVHDTGSCINDIQEVAPMSSMWDVVC